MNNYNDILEKSARNKNRLVLKEVQIKRGPNAGKMQKRWVRIDQDGKEYAEHGSKAEFTSNGKKVRGTVGDVNNGKYSIKDDAGNVHSKHPKEFKPLTDEQADKVRQYASETPISKLREAASSNDMHPELKKIAEKEIRERGNNPHEDNQPSNNKSNGNTKQKSQAASQKSTQGSEPQKGKYSSFYDVLRKEENKKTGGIDLTDPETKQLYNDAKDFSVPRLKEFLDHKGIDPESKKVLQYVMDEKTKKTGDERMKEYQQRIDSWLDTPHSNLFITGKGGIGKTFSLEKAIERENEGNGMPNHGIYDEGIQEVGSNQYNTAMIGRVTPIQLYKLLYVHNGKNLVFDDADDILKDKLAVNILKTAMDTSNSRVGWNTNQKLEYTDPASGEKIEIPRGFKFTGKVMFISNKPKEFFEEDSDRAALLSRGQSMDLQFSNKETHEILDKKIIPNTLKGKTRWKILDGKVPEKKDKEGNFVSYDTDSPQFKKFTENLKEVASLLKTHLDEMGEFKLNGRTIQNLYGVYAHAKKINEEVESGKRPKEDKIDVKRAVLDDIRKSEVSLFGSVYPDIFKALNNLIQ